MIEIKGQYTNALIYTNNPQETEIVLNNRVVPNLVGADVGCDVFVAEKKRF